jgi:pimeloyl-ACP methyl ester carboxylesterase
MAPDNSALVLLHGGSWSGDQWRDIAPLLFTHHDVYTPSALGHRGGPVVQRRPVTMWDVIDESERYLDERGLDRPHLAGHSMGGFIALELARRGRPGLGHTPTIDDPELVARTILAVTRAAQG